MFFCLIYTKERHYFLTFQKTNARKRKREKKKRMTAILAVRINSEVVALCWINVKYISDLTLPPLCFSHSLSHAYAYAHSSLFHSHFSFILHFPTFLPLSYFISFIPVFFFVFAYFGFASRVK